MYKALCARCEHRACVTEDPKYQGPSENCKELRVNLLSCKHWLPTRPIAVVRNDSTHTPSYQASVDNLEPKEYEDYFSMATMIIHGRSVRMWIPKKWNMKLTTERRERRACHVKPKIDRRRKEWKNVPIQELLAKGLI